MNFCNTIYWISGILALILVAGFLAIDAVGKLVFVLLVAQFFIPQVFGLTDPATIQTSLVISTIIGTLTGLGMLWVACVHLGCGTAGFILSVIIAAGGAVYIAATKIDQAATMCFGITF